MFGPCFALSSAYPALLPCVLVALHLLWLFSACVLKPAPLFLPAFQSELRHGPFYYVKQPALTTDPVDVVPQDGRNDFYCWLCHREGQVLCCELCPRVYHAKCLKLPAEPEGDWFCPECEVLTRVCACVCVGGRSAHTSVCENVEGTFSLYVPDKTLFLLYP